MLHTVVGGSQAESKVMQHGATLPLCMLEVILWILEVQCTYTKVLGI